MYACQLSLLLQAYSSSPESCQVTEHIALKPRVLAIVISDRSKRFKISVDE